jgi:hypothetical protein
MPCWAVQALALEFASSQWPLQRPARGGVHYASDSGLTKRKRDPVGVLDEGRFAEFGQQALDAVDRAQEDVVQLTPIAREICALFLMSARLETGPREPWSGLRPALHFETDQEAASLYGQMIEGLGDAATGLAANTRGQEGVVTGLDVARWLHSSDVAADLLLICPHPWDDV